MNKKMKVIFTDDQLAMLVSLAEMALDGLHEELDDFDEDELEKLEDTIADYNKQFK